MNDKKLKAFRILTGLLFAYQIVISIKSTGNNSHWAWLYWFEVAGCLCMSISMFSRCYALLTIGAVGNAIPLCVWLLIAGYYRVYFEIIFSVLGILSYVLLMCAVGKRGSAPKLCIAAAIAMLGSITVCWIIYYYSYGVETIFSQLARVAAIVLSGLVLKNTPVKKRSSTTATQPSVSRIETLSKLKSLLDVGAISQEEFDAKKKQLLED